MELEDKIKEDLKDAIRNKDSATRDVLRFLTSDIKNEMIRIRSERELEEKDVLAVVKKNIKSRKDSVEQFTQGGREDLAAAEQAEIAILEKYMPEEMSEAEVEAIVKRVLANLAGDQAKNFGMVMKGVMQETDGRADGALVSKIVKKTLIG